MLSGLDRGDLLSGLGLPSGLDRRDLLSGLDRGDLLSGLDRRDLLSELDRRDIIAVRAGQDGLAVRAGQEGLAVWVGQEGLAVKGVVGSRVYTCLGITCHLHFWQNDRGLLRATAVTRGWNGHRRRVSTQISSGEEKSPAAPAGIGTRNLSITSPSL